jgi:3-oxoacyl-[acyl-carrier protein] reductase
MASLAKQVAIVTGASRGIGRAIAMELAHDGAAVVAGYHQRQGEAEEVVRTIREAGGVADSCAADVTRERDVRALVEFAIARRGRVDVLVCSAGIVRDQLLGAMTLADWEAVLDVNLRGVFLSVREVLPHMMSQRSGSIVALSSIAADRGGRGHANYVASKGAINAMVRSLAVELAPRNIRVNAVSPGIIVTEMTDRIRTYGGDEMKGQIPLKRFGHPRDVARAVRFLASPEASYITGEILHVTGGYGL